MQNPLFDRQHVKEYILFGTIAAILYMIPVLIFLSNHTYENLYYLYIGCVLFAAAIFYYVYRLLYRRYTGKSAGSMLIAGELATLSGVIIACIFVIIAMFITFPDLFASNSGNQVLEGGSAQPRKLLLMILGTAIIGNVFLGSIISVVVSYAGKRDQTKDKPAPLETRIKPDQNPRVI